MSPVPEELCTEEMQNLLRTMLQYTMLRDAHYDTFAVVHNRPFGAIVHRAFWVRA